MFFPPRRPGPPPKGMPVISGIPGIQLNLNVDHFQLLGTLLMMGLSQRPGFKSELEELVAFIQKMQEAAEAISVQMETVQKEFLRVKSKVAKYQNVKPVQRETSRPQGNPYVNPLLQQLLRMMS
ncbi:hypothetical protein [Desulforamulus putei]|uniref:Uncharacterized protein n=1 Tax=Desulforamulus putei DSM 12395 TaxID=1121429 RepID=A0A1M4UN94_9FIRM|nr:hypothetical protein [Desulforamulus putei]SHE58118.1 hypothetical protein SAMN02745133_00706 [Desulforamulus putei DSM 12395]